MKRKKTPPAGGGEWQVVNLKELQGPQTKEDARFFCAYRFALNLRMTGHPFHHLTADGTVVDADPSLEAALARLGPDEQPTIPPFDPRLARLARPVDRHYYDNISLEKLKQLSGTGTDD